MTEAVERSEIDKIIARIQKMLSRTKDGSGTTEAEADTALKMAQELMAKYNLDMAVIEAAQGPTSTVVERVKEKLDGKAMYKWQRQLAKYVAEANFCYYILKAEHGYTSGWYELDEEWRTSREAIGMELRITGEQRDALPDWDTKSMYSRATMSRSKTTHSHVFVGRKANVITAQLMFQYLTETIENLALVEMPGHHLSRSNFSWKEGCSDRVCERLASRREDLIAEHDARAKQAADEQRAEAQRKRDELTKKPKGLPAHHESEVKAAFENLSKDARQGFSSGPADEDPERPEIDESDIWTPSGDEAEDEDPGTALAVASMFDESEREANLEVARGLEPGTYARWRAEQAEEDRLDAERHAKKEMDAIEAPVKAETERQRKARERREEKEYEQDRRRWARESRTEANREMREYAKRDHKAYRKGSEKGKSVGLDLQISKQGAQPKKLG